MNDYDRIARVIRYLADHHTEQPDLATLADDAGLSPYHFQRLFSRWAGVTPKAFLQCLTLSHARELLRDGESVLDSALDAGLSGPGRLHDLSVRLEAASPGELKEGGEGWTIRYGTVESPFGRCLIASGPRGICHIAFVDGRDDGVADLRCAWPRAGIDRDDAAAVQTATAIFAAEPDERGRAPLKAFVRGSAFQVRVWRALLRVQPGSVISYGTLAGAIGQPGAARAVGSAIGQNPLAYLIPCHRVIRDTGVIGNYHWDPIRKRAMLAHESAQQIAHMA